MKQENKIGMPLLLGLALAVVSLVTYARPAKILNDADKLNQGIALLQQGRVGEAHAVLTNLPASSPVHGQAKAYDALCSYAQGNHKRFLKEMESPEIQTAELPDEVRENLDYKQLDTLMYFRRFDDLEQKAESFQSNHAGSSKLDAVAEIRMAAKFERGMKKTYEAALKTPTNAADHWDNGRADLEKFVAQVSTFKPQDYEVLPKRALKEDLWTALLVLGEEPTLLLKVQGKDREKLGALAIKLHQKLKPAAVDENLDRMKKFLGDFPQADKKKRVEFDMASISFNRGEACLKRLRQQTRPGILPPPIRSASKRTNISTTP